MTTPMVLEEDRSAWFADARLAILRLSITEREFTADDLRKVLRPAAHQNWPGLAFGQAKRAGLIEPIESTTSKSKSRNHGSLKIWRRKVEGVTP
jgi:hypothetical protein